MSQRFDDVLRAGLAARLTEAHAEIAVLQKLLAHANADTQSARAECAVLRREMGWHDQRELGLAERIVELETRCVKCGQKMAATA